MKTEQYYCDLCKSEITNESWQPPKGRGVVTRTRDWHLVATGEGDYDLCISCLTNLQALEPKICAGGFKCNGGPHCGSSHK